MVSLLSFFYTKKKPKRSGPPSPNAHIQEASASTAASASTSTTSTSATRPRPAGRFLSLRHKAAPNPHDSASRRASSEISRRRSQKQASTASSAGGLLPQLDLDFEVRAPEEDEDELLGLKSLGGPAVLKREEKEVLKGLRWSVDDVKLAWQWFGRALRDTGLDTQGIMLPRRIDADQATQFYLLALYALTIQFDLLPSFPSISAQVAQPPLDQPAEVWRERLLASIKDTQNPVDLAEDLKWILRRLLPSATGSDPLISTKVYTTFVQSEHASSYPLASYGTMFCPAVSKSVEEYLEEVFEVCAAIATRAEDNKMAGGRLAYLLGWWVSGLGVGRTDTWEDLYADWQVGGKRMEHLLYAWIRFQSTRQKMPTRLLELIEGYPFGESSASSEHLPLPPPTSFTRRTLHVKVGCTVPTAQAVHDPEEILKTALASKAADGAVLPLWSSLRGEPQKGLSGLLSEESNDFLRAVAQASALTPPSTPLTTPSTPTDDGPLYRPFSQVHSRKRSQSHTGTPPSPSNDAKSDPTTPVAEPKPASPSPSPRKQASMSSLRPVDTQVWDDFSKTGFSTSSNPVGDLGLAFSPISPTGSNGPASPTDSAGVTGGLSRGPSVARRPLPRKKTTFLDTAKPSEAPALAYSLVEEAVIDVDDVFMAFVEDGQLDVVSASWPPFALVRLAEPIKVVTDEKPVEWLLVTIVHRPPVAPRAEDASEPPEFITRPTSPGGASTTSRMSTTRNLRDFANSFRRSSSSGSVGRPSMGMGMRKSFFGSSSRSLSKQAELAPLSENELSPSARRSGELRHPPSAQSLATDYTVGEMGEMIKIPSPGELQQAQEKREVPAETHQLKMAGPASVSGDTAPGDWAYIAEGGAHVVFAYRGKSSSYAGKVIRIRKTEPAKAGPLPSDHHHDIQREWRHELLSKLLPAELLVASKEITLEEKWFMELLGQADAVRPEKRKVDGKTLVESTSGEGKGLLMEDTTVTERDEGHETLAVEIKPKWGFLPDGKLMQPPESVPIKTKNCRFCMHQHLRGHKEEEHKYCPLDLYSGDEARMLKALEGLWEMWSTTTAKANNWRVFVDGHAVTPDQASKIPVSSKGDDMAAKTAPFLLPVLKHSGALAALKALQQNLDATDISDLVVRYKAAYPDATELFDHFHVPDQSLPELKEFVDLYLANPLAGKAEPGWTLRQRLVAYSLSAIFKDCSVFVKSTLEKTQAGEWQLVEGKSSVKVIDLDLKPIKNLRHWAEVDEKVWRNWLETKGAGEEDDEAREADVQSDITSLAVPRFDDRRFLSATFGVHDNASTQALFMPTPSASPMPSPMPTATGSEVGSFSDALSVAPSTLARSAPAHEVEKENKPDVEVLAEPEALPRPSEESTASTVTSTLESEDDSIPVPRRTRSLAPSPSPPPVSRELPETEAEQPEEAPEEPGVLASVAGAGAAAVLAGGAVAIGAVAAAANLVLADDRSETTEVPAIVDDARDQLDAEGSAETPHERHPVNVDIETVPTTRAASFVEPEEAEEDETAVEEQVSDEAPAPALTAEDGEKEVSAVQESQPENEHGSEIAVTPVPGESVLPAETSDEVNSTSTPIASADDTPQAIVEDPILEAVVEPSVISEVPESEAVAEEEPAVVPVAEKGETSEAEAAQQDDATSTVEAGVAGAEKPPAIHEQQIVADIAPEAAPGPASTQSEPAAADEEQATAENPVTAPDEPVVEEEAGEVPAEPVAAFVELDVTSQKEAHTSEEVAPAAEDPVVAEATLEPAQVPIERAIADEDKTPAPEAEESTETAEPEAKGEEALQTPAPVVLPDVTLAPQQGDPEVEVKGLDEEVASMPLPAKDVEPEEAAKASADVLPTEPDENLALAAEEPPVLLEAETPLSNQAEPTTSTTEDPEPSTNEPSSSTSASTEQQPTSPVDSVLTTREPATPGEPDGTLAGVWAAEAATAVLSAAEVPTPAVETAGAENPVDAVEVPAAKEVADNVVEDAVESVEAPAAEEESVPTVTREEAEISPEERVEASPITEAPVITVIDAHEPKADPQDERELAADPSPAADVLPEDEVARAVSPEPAVEAVPVADDAEEPEEPEEPVAATDDVADAVKSPEQAEETGSPKDGVERQEVVPVLEEHTTFVPQANTPEPPSSPLAPVESSHDEDVPASPIEETEAVDEEGTVVEDAPWEAEIGEGAVAGKSATVPDAETPISAPEPEPAPPAETASTPEPVLPTERPLTPPQIPSITENHSYTPPPQRPTTPPSLSRPIIPIIPPSLSDAGSEGEPLVIIPIEDVSPKEERGVGDVDAKKAGEKVEEEGVRGGEGEQVVGPTEPAGTNEPEAPVSEPEGLPAAPPVQTFTLGPAVSVAPTEPTSTPGATPAAPAELETPPTAEPAPVESTLVPTSTSPTEPTEPEEDSLEKFESHTLNTIPEVDTPAKTVADAD
ncbi:hypothetical protein IAT38_005167 [Cryptococcus sp. DSM 104549]